MGAAKSPVKMENLREGGPGWNIVSQMRKVAAGEGEGNAAAGAKDSGNGASTTSVANGDTDTAMSDNSAPTRDESADTPTITTTTTSATTQPPVKPPQAEPGKELDVSKLNIVFDEKLGKDQEKGHQGKKKRLVRYQQNPRENWGPMARARGHA